MTTDNPGNNDTGSKGKSEGSNAGQPSLDEILKGFDSASGTDEGKKADAPLSSDERKELSLLKEERIGRQFETALTDIVTALKGDTGAPESMVRGWLEMESEKNPELPKLIEMRFKNRAQFDKALQMMIPEFQKHLDASGMSVTKGTSGMSAAIRASRSNSNGSKDFGNVDLSTLSDSEFAMQSRAILRAAESGQLT